MSFVGNSTRPSALIQATYIHLVFVTVCVVMSDIINENAQTLLDIIEDMALLIANLIVDNQDADEAGDILNDMYYLYSELVKYEQ